MNIEIDGQARAVPEGTTLAALLETLGQAPNDAATAVNGAFVARGARATHLLQDGDAVLLFRPITGG
ncbi:sulfur carrier protein ThiS [Pelomonas sp. KK5]|uniref:sulfur carrier protein ThiS n=1 Tax=Pelomonas sp. KK5 TaxID=1855730 RepID=UPI00097CBFE1|nr:sulfur carrier protein ThiS [Pelomonas sp. KK5]